MLRNQLHLLKVLNQNHLRKNNYGFRMRDAVRDVLDNRTSKYLAEYVDTSEDLDGYMFYI